MRCKYDKTESLPDNQLKRVHCLAKAEVNDLCYKHAYEQLQAENERLRLEFVRLKDWAESPEELDGYDTSDYVDHIIYIVNEILKETENEN